MSRIVTAMISPETYKYILKLDPFELVEEKYYFIHCYQCHDKYINIEKACMFAYCKVSLPSIDLNYNGCKHKDHPNFKKLLQLVIMSELS